MSYGELTSNGLNEWKAARDLFSLQESVSFRECGLDERLHEESTSEKEWKRPTEVQRWLTSAVLAGHDVICGAGKGTGKTSGYILPIVQHLMHHQPRLTRADGTHAIVLCQNVQECQKTAEMFMSFMKKCCWWLTCSVFAGSVLF